MSRSKKEEAAKKAAKTLGGMSGSAAKKIMGRGRSIDAQVQKAMGGKKKKKK